MNTRQRLERWVLVLASALTLLVVGCSEATTATDMRGESENAIRQADADWATTAAKKDWNTFLTYYAPDASVLAPNMPIATGSDAIKKTFDGITAMPNFAVTWHATKVQAARSGDGGYSM